MFQGRHTCPSVPALLVITGFRLCKGSVEGVSSVTELTDMRTTLQATQEIMSRDGGGGGGGGGRLPRDRLAGETASENQESTCRGLRVFRVYT